ncbi:MAG: SDR family oxidoreductase [Dehalococcoidia bacterium]|nr:SDR family oxidoreductase [Dehalococcoidia bacterium]
MLLEGKTAVVSGVADRHSIAWRIAQRFHEEGAKVTLLVLPRMIDRAEKLATELGGLKVISCDVMSDEDIERSGTECSADGGTDILVHSIAFASRRALDEPFVTTTRDEFRDALDISAYSLVALTSAFMPQMASRGGSVMTLTFGGSLRVFPGYNVMGVAKAALEASVRYLAHDCGQRGVRVNAISAGPVKTLSARGIKGFTRMEKAAQAGFPLRYDEPFGADEVAESALFLASPLSRGITGQVVYVDRGLSILGNAGAETD